MAAVVSGEVTAGVPSAGEVILTYTDTSTGVGTVISRTLVITNPLGIVLATISMGPSLTATYTITSDQWLMFTETLVDNTGTYVGEVSYVSTAFYDYLFPQLVAAITSDCDTFGQIYNLTRAELYKNSAITMGLFGQAVNANADIIQANFYLNSPYYA